VDTQTLSICPCSGSRQLDRRLTSDSRVPNGRGRVCLAGDTNPGGRSAPLPVMRLMMIEKRSLASGRDTHPRKHAGRRRIGACMLRGRVLNLFSPSSRVPNGRRMVCLAGDASLGRGSALPPSRRGGREGRYGGAQSQSRASFLFEFPVIFRFWFKSFEPPPGFGGVGAGFVCACNCPRRHISQLNEVVTGRVYKFNRRNFFRAKHPPQIGVQLASKDAMPAPIYLDLRLPKVIAMSQYLPQEIVVERVAVRTKAVAVDVVFVHNQCVDIKTERRNCRKKYVFSAIFRLGEFEFARPAQALSGCRDGLAAFFGLLCFMKHNQADHENRGRSFRKAETGVPTFIDKNKHGWSVSDVVHIGGKGARGLSCA